LFCTSSVPKKGGIEKINTRISVTRHLRLLLHKSSLFQIFVFYLCYFIKYCRILPHLLGKYTFFKGSEIFITKKKKSGQKALFSDRLLFNCLLQVISIYRTWSIYDESQPNRRLIKKNCFVKFCEYVLGKNLKTII